eukprot:gnl/Trimastix_PCT/4031.p1 GENE.gnl/Trimastix_PCT/4031~~gnl/Trimastix_PCT/4031.p1  ORF type:complete len:391 (+),score=62.64 gnl/Trimastix_PCT/4031:262-1434(+)
MSLMSVIPRYLQVPVVCGHVHGTVRGFSILGSGYFLLLIVQLFLYIKFRTMIVWKDLKIPMIWLTAVFIMIRSCLTAVSCAMIDGAYVQLMALLTPFWTAYGARLIFKEPLPPCILLAMIATAIGGFLTIGGDAIVKAAMGSHPHKNLVTALLIEAGVKSSHGGWNFWATLGLILVTVSTFFQAGAFICLSRVMSRKGLSSGTIYFAQSVVISVSSFILSPIFGERWFGEPAGHLYPMGYDKLDGRSWFAYFFIVFVVLFGGNYCQMFSARFLGAPMMSSMLAVRLVCSVALCQLFICEGFTCWLQYIGALITIVTVTVFLANAGRVKTKRIREKEATEALAREQSLQETSSVDMEAESTSHTHTSTQANEKLAAPLLAESQRSEGCIQE